MRKLKVQMIESKQLLEQIAGELSAEDAVAVDLEADSMFHFQEKVCLIQMASKSRGIVIDPLKIDDLSALKPLFANPGIMKIFHGADYDIRSLYRDFQIEVQNLFDTQLASHYLGLLETGLEAVLRKRFNVRLNKKYQKKDWSERPLPEEMVEYAAQDVIYLIPLAQQLISELKRVNRLQWVTEECEILSRVRPMETNDSPLFLKYKGAGRFSPRRLAVLEALLRLRVKIAREKDRPLFKVFGNASITKLTTLTPRTMEKLKKSKALSAKQISMFGDQVLEAVESALKLPENQLPQYPRKKPPTLAPSVPTKVKALKQWRDRRANKLDIDPAIIATKALITSIAVASPRDLSELSGLEELRQWQKREFGPEIIRVLSKVK